MREPPYDFIADGLMHGDVVPFFGAAASAVYNRGSNEAWEPGKSFMPFGGELATALAKAANYTAKDESLNAALADIVEAVARLAATVPADTVRQELGPVLSRHLGSSPELALVASWAEHVQGSRRAVDRKLHQSFSVECSPGLLHNKLGGITATMLYITTNYDDLLEQALAHRSPHVLVDRGDRGLWVSVAGGPMRQVAATGTDLDELLNDPQTLKPTRPIIFKMHGSADKVDARNGHYQITEEDYVDFLGRTGGSYIPPYVHGLMQGKDFLFLGYSLEDWNVRVILRKLSRAKSDRRSWAIVRGRSDAEQQIWQADKVNIYPMNLLTFADQLATHL